MRHLTQPCGEATWRGAEFPANSPHWASTTEAPTYQQVREAILEADPSVPVKAKKSKEKTVLTQSNPIDNIIGRKIKYWFKLLNFTVAYYTETDNGNTTLIWTVTALWAIGVTEKASSLMLDQDDPSFVRSSRHLKVEPKKQHFISIPIWNLKIREKYIPRINIPKESWYSLIISNIKSITREKRCIFHNDKSSVHQEYITVVNLYASKEHGLDYIKQKVNYKEKFANLQK